jgi:hypothetical protein
MDAQKPGLQPDFEGSATPPLDWQREINNAARFVMDMSSQPVPPIEAYEADFETAGPDPARYADRIAHDFIP